LTRHGFRDATTNLDQVARWWSRWKAANIGLPTGRASGLDVVDVDRRGDFDGFASFRAARERGLVGDALALVRTPSGGMHAYYPAHPTRAQGSWQAARAKVDFRSDGGYVIVPPSFVVSYDRVGGYTLNSGPEGSPKPVDGLALRSFLDPPRIYAIRNHGLAPVTGAQRLAAWVSALGEGERNRGLFWASCRLAEAGLSVPEIMATLGGPAERIGLPAREINATIRSAYRITGTTTVQSGAGRVNNTNSAGASARRTPPSADRVLA
jgi:hypothetical protein